MWDEPSQCYFFHNQALQPLLFGKDVMIWGAETVDGMFRCPSLRCWIWKLHQSNSINIEWDIPCDLCLCIIYYPYVICVSCAFGLYTICIDTYGHGYSEFCLCTKDIFYIHTAIDMTHIYIYIYISEAFNDLKRSCPKFDGQDVFLTHSEVYVSQGINEWKVSEPENAPFSWKVLTVTNYEADQIFYHPLNLP